MLTIRLERVGKKNRAQFKIVLQEHRIAPGGAHVEILGNYDPHTKNATLKEDRIKYWLSQGVQPSDTVYNLFVSKGIIAGAKRKVKIPAKKVEPAAAEAKADKEVAAEAPAVAEVKTETVEFSKAKVVAPVAENIKEEKPKDEAKSAEEAPKTEEVKTKEKKEVAVEMPKEETPKSE
ncbi:MAG: 30S ribosomal protein S16 [Patescibacteria group bacterium]